jgi:hypothetical protein
MKKEYEIDCGCIVKVYADGSRPDIEFCDMHWAAPDLLKASQKVLRDLEGGELRIETINLLFEAVAKATL